MPVSERPPWLPRLVRRGPPACFALAALLSACGNDGASTRREPPGDAGLGLGAISTTADAGEVRRLCGGVGEACCEAPLPPCSAALECGADGACVATSDTTRSRLCTSDGECGLGETCCPQGAFGACTPLQEADACPLPDLALRLDQATQLELRQVSNGECEIGCNLPVGSRRLLRLLPTIVNLGAADVILGTSNSPGIEEECAGTFLAGGLRFELTGEGGSATGDGHLRLSANDTSGQQRFNSSMLGLAAGFVDSNAAGCSWLDISGLAPGLYTLRVSLTLDGLVPDANPSNNVVETRVDLSGEVLAACDADEPQSPSGDRDCGWSVAAAFTCTPNESVIQGCGSCSGSPILRACEGSEPCGYASRGWLASSSSFYTGQCPAMTFTCPRSGTYVVLSGATDDAPYACEPAPLEFTNDPLATCGAADLVLGGGTTRNCSWAASLAADCVPGTQVEVGCPVCASDPILRVCDGPSPCLSGTAAELGSIDDSVGLCPTLAFQCPASGSYSTYFGSLFLPEDPGVSCDVSLLAGAAEAP